MKIMIMGTPVTPGNRGVMALGASLVDLFSETNEANQISFLLAHRPTENVRLLTSQGEKKIPVVTCRMNPLAGFRHQIGWILIMSALFRFSPSVRIRSWIAREIPWIHEVNESDLVGEIRGGDSLSDIYGIRRMIVGLLPALSVVILKKDLILLPQTYGPYKSTISRVVAKWLVRRSKHAYARDFNSFWLARSMHSKPQRVRILPDVAFTLCPKMPEHLNFNKPSAIEKFESRQLIGINVNGLILAGGYNRENDFGLCVNYQVFLIESISRILSMSDNDVLLIPHTYATHGDPESDNEASQKIHDALPADLQSRVHLVHNEYDQHELKGIIGMCEFFIGSRMHACIAALSQFVPCAALAYSNKFHGVFESVGMEDWVIDARHTDTNSAIERMVELYRKADTVRDTLEDNVQFAKDELRRSFRELTRSIV